MPTNGHLSDSDGLDKAGTITDRNGVVLAESRDGKRIYNEDQSIRCACLPVIGDNSVNNSTAIQTVYRPELSGYNFIFGLGLPDEIKSGQDIQLTIDSKMQKAAYEALGGSKGAVVVYNYKTGELLCLASTPTYDPYDKTEDINTNPAYEGAYLNRAISSAYPPGSTFKLVTAAAALEYIDNAEHREYECEGSTEIGGKIINCYEISGHIEMKEALMTSCNGYFAHLAVDLGKSKMTDQATKMGFNSSFEFDGITTGKSVYDVSKADENELAWSGVGQYQVLETPINMAMRSAAIANGGSPMKPFLIKNMSAAFGAWMPDRSSSKGSSMMSSSEAEKLTEMMDYTVANYYGKASFPVELDVCAKTGTAEISDGGSDAHAWVTGFTKSEEHPYAFAVIVENGNSGYQVAIPVASAVLNSVL